ncbi:MAG TPA: glycine cleavage system protein GcvH [Thermomicrobiaceae bacterium]|nr:glycine cleavage system protein GcvH [Thermomicrobiaceae bacterium]
MTEVPQDLRYTRTHEWARIDGDVATVGVDDYAQNELGDLTYLELPEPGTSVTQSEPMGVIESVKAASDLYAPVSGEVIEANPDAANAPDLVNSSPYQQGWLLRVRMSDPGEANNLMDASSYEKFLEEQGGGH